MIYGILVFVLQYTSRRQANGEITHPMIEQNLRLLFPELESMPHADTLFRLLSRIDVEEIEQAQIELVNQLASMIRRMGVRPFLDFVRTTLSGPWLHLFRLDEVAQCMRQPFRLRFV